VIQLLRGRTLIRMTADQDGTASELERIGLVAPGTLASADPRQRANQNSLGRGVVIAMGAPALSKRGAEVPPGYGIGDEVLFIGQGKARAVQIDGEWLQACAQEEVVAVIE